MKKYDIKTTDKETLRKWFYLMTLGRAIDEKAPSYLLQSLGWSYHAPYAFILYTCLSHTNFANLVVRLQIYQPASAFLSFIVYPKHFGICFV